MKCPIREVPKFDEEGEAHFEPADCLMEECAWWYEGESCCAMTAIAIDLTAIFNMTSAVLKKMPHKE